MFTYLNLEGYCLMFKNEKIELILQEIEHYLLFDDLQREYAGKGIREALIKIEKKEKINENHAEDNTGFSATFLAESTKPSWEK